ncbi:inositol monophosphatase family protein [Micromonospora fluostatini]|uniref:inositol monophosphatase family protein n=1 Tax=Micromonospora sp. JCM 30529 TaxID=3421643 RepID=UPI003D1839F6
MTAATTATSTTTGTGLARHLLAVAVRAAEAGGAELRRRAGRTRLLGHKSTGTDPVTEADLASEDAVIRVLGAERPADGLLGEEGTVRAGTSGLRWVVDPLDGTTNYLYGLPDFAVSVACERRTGRPDGPGHWLAVAGVVHDPVRGETFTAVRGEGARLDGAPIAVTDPVDLAGALVATGFGYGSASRARQAATAHRLLPAVRDIRSNGSAALTLCWVAAGRYDAYYEDELARWDWAAGALVAREAGARVTALGSGVLVAAPALHHDLSRLVAAPPGTSNVDQEAGTR